MILRLLFGVPSMWAGFWLVVEGFAILGSFRRTPAVRAVWLVVVFGALLFATGLWIAL